MGTLSSQMKIGIICPTGNLEMFGYHHILDIVLQSFCDFADRIVIISSSKNAHFKLDNHKIQLISSPQTWFNLDENGNECYNMDKLISNENIGLDVLANDGFDIALILHINQYIPKTKFHNLKIYLQNFFQSGKPFTWQYKMYQCGSLLFDADRKLPWIFNLHYRERYKKGPDSILHFRKWLFWHSTKKVAIQTGSFKAFNDISVVDVIGEFTENESKALWEFVQNYGGMTKNSMLINGEYNHGRWLKYMVDKLKEKHRSSNQLDAFGTAIYKQSKPEFVSHELLRRIQQ